MLLLVALITLCTLASVNSECGCGGNQCCSKWGYCGNGAAYCGDGCREGPCQSNNKPPPPQNNGGNNGGSTRCGTDWGNAAGKCGTACPSGTDAECPGGQHCYNQLSTAPCGGGNPPPPPPPPQNNPNPSNNGRVTVATWYCSLSDSSKGSCFPGSCGTFAAAVSGFGIAAMNPSDFGSGSVCHYKGTACGQCWQLHGPGGTKNIQVTDCCAGYAGSPSCLSSSNPMCDWCAANDHQHFDLDWDSFQTVCGSEVNKGNCHISSSPIACPAGAVADTTDPTLLSSNTTPAGVPTWGIALFVLSSIMIVALIAIIVILARISHGAARV